MALHKKKTVARVQLSRKCRLVRDANQVPQGFVTVPAGRLQELSSRCVHAENRAEALLRQNIYLGDHNSALVLYTQELERIIDTTEIGN
jgi:hypothetical protein